MRGNHVGNRPSIPVFSIHSWYSDDEEEVIDIGAIHSMMMIFVSDHSHLLTIRYLFLILTTDYWHYYSRWLRILTDDYYFPVLADYWPWWRWWLMMVLMRGSSIDTSDVTMIEVTIRDVHYHWYYYYSIRWLFLRYSLTILWWHSIDHYWLPVMCIILINWRHSWPILFIEVMILWLVHYSVLKVLIFSNPFILDDDIHLLMLF